MQVEKWGNTAKTRNAALHNAAALCAVGAEKSVSNEIKKLGLAVIDTSFGKVRFQADAAGLYRALIGLRAADRILLEAGVFPANDFDALFEKTAAIAWEKLIPARMGLKVAKVRSNRSQLRAETSIQAIVHKAAAQRLCRANNTARLPENDGSDQGELRAYVEKNTVSILLDLSGDPLFKRGYRREGGIAPLRETTAMAMLLLSGWKRKFPLYDPFCGSGTILAEAFLFAVDAAPGLCRKFAIDKLLIADSKTEDAVRREFSGKINFQRKIRIAGSDEDAASAALADSNLKRALKIASYPQNAPPGGAGGALPAVQALPMIKALPPFTDIENDEPAGFIVTNPPYGKRLGDPAASEKIYGEMQALAKHFPRWKLAVITDHPGFESFFCRKADSVREISNGPIPSYIFQYEKL